LLSVVASMNIYLFPSSELGDSKWKKAALKTPLLAPEINEGIESEIKRPCIKAAKLSYRKKILCPFKTGSNPVKLKASSFLYAENPD